MSPIASAIDAVLGLFFLIVSYRMTMARRKGENK